MPVYDYKCEQHGAFYELATFDEAHQPQACPVCSALSPRIIRLPPEILDMAPERRKAFATNEKAQHEPVISTKDRRSHDHEHANGCGCQHGKKSKLMYTARREKMLPSMRPWMINH